MWNDFGSQSFLKVPNAPLASLARSLRSPCGFSLGFRWGFAGVSLAILDRKPPKRSANLPQNPWKIELNTPQNPPQNPPESTPKPKKKRGLEGVAIKIAFCHFLCAAWGRLGAFGSLLKHIGACLQHLDGVLGHLLMYRPPPSSPVLGLVPCPVGHLAWRTVSSWVGARQFLGWSHTCYAS